MPEPADHRSPGLWPQVVAILKLSALQARNQFSRSRTSRKGLRAATANKDIPKIVLPVLLGLLMLGVATNTCYQAVHGLAHYAQHHWPTGVGIEPLEVGIIEYWQLERRALNPEMYAEQSLIDSLKGQGYADEAAARARAAQLNAQLKKHGMGGFVKTGTDNPYKFADLRELSPKAASWFGRVLAITFGCLVLALIFMPLSARNKDLGAVDAQLAWLYCLPLGGREILSGRFISMALVRPLTWLLLWPLFSVLLWAMGFGLLSVLVGLVASLAVSVACTGVELAIETWMRTSGSFQARKNIQSLASILGTASFCLAMAAGISAARSVDWINWILGHTPGWLTAAPGNFLLLPVEGPAGLLPFVAILLATAAACGFGGWVLAAKALRHGLSSGNERAGTRAAGAAHATARSLTKFEWLLLMRDRNLATMVIIVPLIMVAYQLLVNPQMLAVTSAHRLAVIGFGCGIWAATMTAPHVLLSESNSLWMIFALPVEISDHFKRRTRVWRMAGIGMAGAVTAGLALWKGVPADGWWRIPIALAAVWAVSRVVYAIMIGNAKLPDATRGERPKISITRVYACMLIAGLVGATLWHGTPWQIFTSLVLWWFFGFGMWQSVTRRLQFLLEPTDPDQPQLTLASAILAVLVFFMAQAIAAMFMARWMADDLALAMLYSYTIGGIAALGYCGIRLFHLEMSEVRPWGPDRAGDPARKRLGLAVLLPLCTAGCIAGGWLWLTALHTIPTLRTLYEGAQNSAAVQIDTRDWHIVLLAVVAAPLIEELIFRGFVFRIMRGAWSARGAILANALLFAIVHPAMSFPPVFLLGLASAWLYARSGKLWACILLHAAYNAAILAMS